MTRQTVTHIDTLPRSGSQFLRFHLGIVRVTTETPDCVLPTHGENDSVTSKHLFSPQADHKHFLRVVPLDCVFTTDLTASSVRAAALLADGPNLPLSLSPLSTLSRKIVRFLSCCIAHSSSFAGSVSAKIHGAFQSKSTPAGNR